MKNKDAVIIACLVFLIYMAGAFSGVVLGILTPTQLCVKTEKSYCSNNYIAPYYACPHELQFENITGQYCNNRLVCKNGAKANE